MPKPADICLDALYTKLAAAVEAGRSEEQERLANMIALVKSR